MPSGVGKGDAEHLAHSALVKFEKARGLHGSPPNDRSFKCSLGSLSMTDNHMHRGV
jgi:hypothetical protein